MIELNNNINERIKIAKQIAKIRHVNTVYDKFIHLMYDENGTPTELRNNINKIIAKIVKGELDKTYLAGINFEIKYAEKQRKLKIKKIKDKVKNKSQEKQIQLLLLGIKKFEKSEEKRIKKQLNIEESIHIQYQSIMLKIIHLDTKSIKRLTHKILTKN